MLESLAGCLTELCATGFYWILFFISALFDILASLSISRVFFQTVFQVDENPPAQIFPEQLSNLII